MSLSFRQGKETSYEWPITVKLPSQRIPGQFTNHTFTAVFHQLPTTESRQLVADSERARAQGRTGEAMDLDKDILRRALAGWRGLEEEFSEENLEECMDNPFFLLALMDGYRKSVSGEGVQRLKAKN